MIEYHAFVFYGIYLYNGSKPRSNRAIERCSNVCIYNSSFTSVCDLYYGCAVNRIVEFFSARSYSVAVKPSIGSVVWDILF
jgi:hypothetical protein